MTKPPILNVQNLCTIFKRNCVHLRDVAFNLNKGEIMGLVGESGLVEWQGQELGAMAESDLRKIHGRDFTIIFQEPMTALDMTIQAQVLDLIRDLSKEFEMAVLLVTHDLGVVA